MKIIIGCDHGAFELKNKVKALLEGMGYELKQREAAMVPNNYTRVDDPDTLKKLALLFDNLEEDDDVQNVWNNLENSEDLPEL